MDHHLTRPVVYASTPDVVAASTTSANRESESEGRVFQYEPMAPGATVVSTLYSPSDGNDTTSASRLARRLVAHARPSHPSHS